MSENPVADKSAIGRLARCFSKFLALVEDQSGTEIDNSAYQRFLKRELAPPVAVQCKKYI